MRNKHFHPQNIRDALLNVSSILGITDNFLFMRIVQMLQLEQNPELIRQYRYFHSPEGIWPEILQGIKDSGILEMEIYLLEHYLCMIVDLPEHLSWEEAMERMAKAPRQTEWEAFVAQFQRAAANARSDEKWQRMERIFHLYPNIKP